MVLQLDRSKIAKLSIDYQMFKGGLRAENRFAAAFLNPL